VRDLVADHGLDLFARHALQQAGGHRDQRGVLERAGGEGVGLALEDADFGHADAGLVGELAHGLDDPGLVGVLGRRSPHAGAPLGDGLLISSEMMAPPKPMMSAKPEQHAQVQPVGREVAVDAQQAGDDAQHRHHGEVGQDEQEECVSLLLRGWKKARLAQMRAVGPASSARGTRGRFLSVISAVLRGRNTRSHHKRKSSRSRATSRARRAPARA
jgi:hypothetical protein